MAQIQFHHADAKIALKDRTRLKAFLKDIFLTEKTALRSLNYIFCSDEYLIEINRQFLAHDDYTDIITFNLAEDKQPVEGEIYISIDRIKDNAITHNVSLVEELHRVIFHGALHLCGYKDKTHKEAAQMRQGETKYLEAYFK